MSKISLCLIMVLYFSLFVFSKVEAGSTVDPTWNYFKPEQTSEFSVVSAFGAPDIVKIESNYEGVKNATQADGKLQLTGYTLHYDRKRGDLNILKGPLGESSSIDVVIENNKVIEVDWVYDMKFKPIAEEAWKNDKSFVTYVGKVGETLTIASKKISDGRTLFVDCLTGKNNSCDGAIRVRLLKISIPEDK